MLGRPGTYRLILALIAFTLPIVGWAAFCTLQTNANSPLDWVSSRFPARADYDAFREQFGSGDLVVMSWPGCTVDDRRLDQVAKYLRRSKHFFNEDYQWDFERVTTGREVFQQLISHPLNLTVAEAKRRLQGTLLGPDGQTTCAIVSLTPAALTKRRDVVLALHAVLNTCEIPLADQHLAGPVIDGLSVDEAGRRSMSTLALPSAIVVFLVCWWSLNSFPGACLVFALSLYAQALTLALLHMGGETMSAVLIVLPPLIQVLAVAGGIHLINYYWESARTGSVDQAASKTLHRGWLPCTLASGTTALGLMSLLVSDLVPIRLFGTYGAAGVIVTLALLLAVLPATLHRWPLTIPKMNRHSASPSPKPWPLMTRLIDRFQMPIAILAFGLMILGGLKLNELHTSVRIETLFQPQSRIMHDYRWLEEHVAPMVPIEVVLRFPVNEHWPLTKQMKLVQQAERNIAQVRDVGGTISGHAFFSTDCVSPAQAQPIQLESQERLLELLLPTFIESHFLAETTGELEYLPEQGIAKPRYKNWRITAHVSALRELDYGRLLQTIRAKVEPLLPASEDQLSQKVQATYTGIMPLVHAIQRQLMANLFQSFLMAFGTITFVMMLLQGGIFMGLLSMVPNVFPALLILGCLAWAGIKIDIGSVMTISLGLGIAVDDTLHFLVNYRRSLEAGNTRKAAIQETYEHCGAAMLQTSVTCGLGLLIFALSDFLPTCRFAWMMLAFLMLALLGDLLLLPALLLSPLGRCFTLYETSPSLKREDDTDSNPNVGYEITGLNEMFIEQ